MVMQVWAAVILVIALVGAIINIIIGAPMWLWLHYAVQFLIALGMLMRIRHKTREGEKEKLQQAVGKLTAK